MSNRQQAAERSLHNQVNILSTKELLIVFPVLAAVLLITFIDQNGISVTLPTIAKDLHAEDTISWAGTSSLIANTTFQMLYGRISDIFGRKTVYLSAIAMLSIATLLCGISHNATMFYVFRAIAGISSGGLANLSMIIISDSVTLERRGKYQGIIGACVGLGNVIGPFLAAGCINLATWRVFFWTVSPLTAVVGILSFCFLRPTPPTLNFRASARKIDYGGVLLSSIGVIFLLIPISGGGSYFPWKSPMVISMLAIGSLSLFLFVLWEWKVATLPMMPVQSFCSPSVCIILVQCVLLGAVYQAYLYYLPLYLQNARQLSVMQSAGVIASMVAMQAVTSILSGLYISHFKRWKEVVFTGFGLWTFGSALSLLYKRDTSLAVIIIPLLIVGMGVGCVFQPTLVALQSKVPLARRAVIISNRNFFRCAGGAVGLAVSAAMLQAALRSSLPAEYQYLARHTYALPKTQGPNFEAVLDAYMAASRNVFILQVPLIGICLLSCFFLRDHGLEYREDEGDGGKDEGPK